MLHFPVPALPTRIVPGIAVRDRSTARLIESARRPVSMRDIEQRHRGGTFRPGVDCYGPLTPFASVNTCARSTTSFFQITVPAAFVNVFSPVMAFVTTSFVRAM